MASLATVLGVPLDPESKAELVALGESARDIIKRRDAAIVKAHINGGGVREIARDVGLNHATVIAILKRDKP